MIAVLIAAALAAQPTITDAKAEVLRELRDPASAVFRGVRPLRDEAGRHYGFCGFVNARNGYGGMTGDNLFIYNFRKRAVAIVPAELSSPELCP